MEIRQDGNIYLSAMQLRRNAPVGFWAVFAVVFTLSLGGLVAVTIASVALTPKGEDAQGGDTQQYLAIGQSLAGGHGYKDMYGPWPDRPAYDRMPGWPAVIALALRLAPGAEPLSVVRFANAFCLALAGALFSVLTRRFGGGRYISIFAGLAISFSPPLLYLSVLGWSEICFVLFVALGMNGIFAGGRWLYWGALALGAGSLVRTNFAPVPLVFFCLASLLPSARRAMRKERTFARLLLACAIATTPTVFWAIRNDSVSGRFPLLSSLEGETLYGANNEVVANDLTVWGYWIMPDSIPGEPSKLSLAKTLPSDLALNDYYHHRAVLWMKGHLLAMPRLVLGKLVRGFAPIPWRPLIPSFLSFAWRFLLLAAYVALMPFWWSKISRIYLLLCLAMFLVDIVTIVVYYGSFRMTHCFVEIFFVPCIFLGLQEYFKTRHGSPRGIR